MAPVTESWETELMSLVLNLCRVYLPPSGALLSYQSLQRIGRSLFTYLV